MKKFIFTLLALVGTMSMNAQVMKPGMEIMKNGVVVATYTADQADEVVFKEVPAPTTGTAERTGGVSVNWVQLWENGPKFAEYNVGATSVTDYGGYYNWGMSEVQTKANYTNYQSGTDALSGETDTATNLWGSKWLMPTSAELSDAEGGLLYECDCVWTENYNGTGANGLLCTGKEGTAYENNSVFLPAAGRCDSGDFFGQGNFVFYWSSTPNGSNNAYCLDFSSGVQDVYGDYRESGYSVRAVLNEVVE